MELVIGLDIGQKRDPTAVCVAEIHQRQVGEKRKEVHLKKAGRAATEEAAKADPTARPPLTMTVELANPGTGTAQDPAEVAIVLETCDGRQESWLLTEWLVGRRLPPDDLPRTRLVQHAGRSVVDRAGTSPTRDWGWAKFVP